MSVLSRTVEPGDHESVSAGQGADSRPLSLDSNRDGLQAGLPLELSEPPSPVSRRRRHRYSDSRRRSISSIDEATDSQLLKRVVRAIEDSQWNDTTVLGLLKTLVNSPLQARLGGITESSPQPTRLGVDPRTRILIPGPGLVDYTDEDREALGSVTNCARSHFRHAHLPSFDHGFDRCDDECTHPRPQVFIVIGLFEGPDMAPKERIVYVKHHNWVFWSLWWGIVRLRGLRYIFSLKDCTAFRIYKV
jgi:hypothetical protein